MEQLRGVLNSLNRCKGAGHRMGHPTWKIGHHIGMAREHIKAVWNFIKQLRHSTSWSECHRSISQLQALRIWRHLRSQNSGHELVAIAHPKNRHPGISASKNPLTQLHVDRVVIPSISGRATENDPVPFRRRMQRIDVRFDTDPAPLHRHRFGSPPGKPTADIPTEIRLQTRRPNHRIHQQHPSSTHCHCLPTGNGTRSTHCQRILATSQIRHFRDPEHRHHYRCLRRSETHGPLPASKPRFCPVLGGGASGLSHRVSDGMKTDETCRFENH